jgi:chromosomal replication initiator protein
MTAAVSIERIKAMVAADYGVPVRSLAANQRQAAYVRPRHVAIYLACGLTPHSSVVIGRQFGKRDHTTVLYALRKIAELRDADGDFDRRVRSLEARLAPPAARPEFQLAFLTGPLFDRAIGVAA